MDRRFRQLPKGLALESVKLSDQGAGRIPIIGQAVKLKSKINLYFDGRATLHD